MKLIGLCAAGLFLTSLCNAQDELVFQQSSDSESEGVAREFLKNLQPVKSPPKNAAFYSLQSLQSKNLPPLPANPFPELPVYAWGNAYIFDDWDVDYVAMKEQGISLFETTDTASKEGAPMMAADGPTPPGEGGGGVWTNSFSPAYSYSSNELWLEITGVTNNAGYFVVHTPDTNAVDLFATTNLSPTVPELNLTNWLWLLRTAAPQTNIVITNLWPTEGWFRMGTMQDSDSDQLTDAYERLVTHTDPDNWDSDGDGMPDGWEWDSFGNFNQTANGDYDGDSVSNLSEYQQGTDPNSIQFAVDFDYLRVGAGGPLCTFSISSGVPAFIGVLIDSTNFASTSWLPYTSSFTPDLGSTDGRKTVWLTLKGRANSSQGNFWQEFHFIRDTTPPLIVITNPTVSTVLRPTIQLQGYSPEPLRSLRYNIINDLVSLTNQEGHVTKQWFDTNFFELTTNWFACLDIPLASGTNTVSLFATDLAGNISSNVYTYILDYSQAANPVIKLHWPEDGAQLSGGNFTCRGWVDDPTAKVFGSLVNTNGTLSTFALVERNGNFWVENLPLTVGTNVLTLTVTNSAGLTSVTNISVVKSDLVLTMNPIPDLWQPYVSVSGTVSDVSCAVWINDVKAVVNSNGTWSATGVPVNDGGTASFVITAYAPGEQQPNSPN